MVPGGCRSQVVMDTLCARFSLLSGSTITSATISRARELLMSSGVSIKFEAGSWLEKNNQLYEQGAVARGSGGMLHQNIFKSGSSEIPFPAFWAPNYHASTFGNYSVCLAIRCVINVKKNSSMVMVLGKRFYWQNVRGVSVLESVQLCFQFSIHLSLFFSFEPI